MSNLASRLSKVENTSDLVEIMKDVEVNAREFPDRSASYSFHLLELFSNPSSSVRKCAFNSAVSIIANQPSSADQLLTAYKAAILSPDCEISKQAISYLPQFVATATDKADSLVKAALEAVSKHTGTSESQIYISQAIDIIRR